MSIQPTGLWPAQDDIGLLGHAARDCQKVVLLRLIDILVKLSVNRPNPPLFRDLERKVAPALMGSPSTQMEVLFAAEQGQEQDKPVVPVVVTGYCIDWWPFAGAGIR